MTKCPNIYHLTVQYAQNGSLKPEAVNDWYQGVFRLGQNRKKSLFRSDFSVGEDRVARDRREDVEIFGSEFDCSDDCAVGIVNYFVEHSVYLTFYIYNNTIVRNILLT